MKKAQKVLSVLLVALMAFALTAVTAFAAAPESGTITVTGKKDQTYTLYKLFDAKITFTEEGEQRAVAYTVPEGKSLDGNAWFEVKDGFVVAKEGVDTDWAKDAEAIAWAKEFGTQVGEAKTASADNEEVKFEGLDWGYYFVDSTLGAFISVTSDNPNGAVVDKNELPTIEKVITAANKGSVDGDGANAIAEMGATVTYKITVHAKPGAENYVVVDTLPDGIKAPADTDVAVAGGTRASGELADVTVSGQEVKVAFKKAALDKVTEDVDFTITFDGTVKDSAVVGEPGNPSTAYMTYGHSENNKTDEITTTVYTAQISIKKTDNSGEELAEAGFAIKNSEDKYYKFEDGVVSWVDEVSDATEKFSGSDGAVEAFVGLADGTYTLFEVTVPDGYSKMEEKTITVKAADEDGALTDANLKQSATVENKPGVVLPETGALGTQIFYIIGVLAILGAGVFMVTNKRIAKEEI